MRITKLVRPRIALHLLGTCMIFSSIAPTCGRAQSSDSTPAPNVSVGSPQTGGEESFTNVHRVVAGGDSATIQDDIISGHNGKVTTQSAGVYDGGGAGSSGVSGGTTGSTRTHGVSVGGNSAESVHPIIRALIYARTVKSTDVYFLCLSVVACLVAFSILRQSIAFQRMLTEGKEKAPDPEMGATTSWLLFFIVFGICIFYGVATAQGKAGYVFVGDFINDDGWRAAVAAPRAFANAFMIASVAPGFIAICKFIAAAFILYSRRAGFRGVTRLLATKEDAGSALERIEESVNSLKTQFLTLETQRARGTNPNHRSDESKPDYIRAFALTMALVFAVIMGVLVVASRYAEGLSHWALVLDALLVMILIGAMALTRGGKLSQKALMEVFRRAFEVIRHPGTISKSKRKISGTQDDSTNDSP